MNKCLQTYLSVFLIIFVVILTKAQTNRVQPDIKNQKLDLIQSSEIKNAPNIPEVKNTQKLEPTASGKSDSLVSTTSSSNFSAYKEKVKQNYSEQRKLRQDTQAQESEKQVNSNINQPIFPELKVEAIQEIPYENNIEIKEKPSAKLERTGRVPFSDAQPVTTTTETDKITISPSKRKYLEAIVSELEKEIQQNSSDISISMQAKKKELEDLKKLLVQ